MAIGDPNPNPSPLQTAIMVGFPGLNVRQMADLVGVSYQAAYKWFDKGKLPSARVKPLIIASDRHLDQQQQPLGALKREALLPFVL